MLEPDTRESLIARLPDHADRGAWHEFVELYEPLIYGIGRRHGLQPADASDLVQDVLVAVANSIERFEPDQTRGRFRSWLFRVARNQSLQRLRQLKSQVTGTGDSDVQRMLDRHSASDSQTEFGFGLSASSVPLGSAAGARIGEATDLGSLFQNGNQWRIA